MSSRTCKACNEKKGNRPGTLCHTCWDAAGRPTAEQVRAERQDTSNEPLVDDPTETDLQAMEALWLQQGKAKTVRQRAWVPLYKESAKSFRDRMDRLKGQGESSGASSSPEDSERGSPAVAWDRTGPCPTCQRTWDRITNDLGHERVVELLGEEWGEKQGAT
jgi:hypothetical protein